jgi:serine/threonine protein kinase
MAFPDGYHFDRSIRAPTNVWSIAASMHQLITTFSPDIIITLFHPAAPGQIIRVTAHPDAVYNQYIFPYSDQFIDTLLHCLALNPAERITTSDIVRKTTQMVALYEVEDRLLWEDPLTNYQIPNELPTRVTAYHFKNRGYEQNVNPRKEPWPQYGVPASARARLDLQAKLLKSDLLFDNVVGEKPAPPTFDQYPYKAMYPMPHIISPPPKALPA